jgi:hypothetical protein
MQSRIHAIWISTTAATIVACGGGGGNDGDDGGNGEAPVRAFLDIREPINGNGQFSTRAPSIEISGTGFVSPGGVDCVSVFPARLSLTWRNTATGQSDSGTMDSFCQNTFLGLQWGSRWAIPYGAIDLAYGDNEIRISASDSAGNTGTATIIVTRDVDVVAPFISATAPGIDATDIPVNRSVAVTFSEPMLRSSLTADRLVLADRGGLPVRGSRGYDENNNRWSFAPEFDLEYLMTYTVTVSGAVEDEYGGNTLGGDFVWSFTTAPNPDVTPPRVTEVSPSPASTCVAPDAQIVARFDEPLASDTVNSGSFVLTQTGGSGIEASVTYNGTNAVLDPLLPLLSGTAYEALIGADVTDLAGNPLGTDFSWSFSTADGAGVGAWLPTSPTGAPFERRAHSAVWTGTEVIIWGGYGWDATIGAFVETDSGGRYDPIADAWRATNADGVGQRSGHSAVVTSNEMIVWGGDTSTGARYDLATDTWLATSTAGAPAARSAHAAVWTGTQMLVWGGESAGGSTLNTGARYDPATDTWTAISTTGAPAPRRDMAYVWTGTELVIWGGISAVAGATVLSDGARYDPATDTWTPLPAITGSIAPRPSAVWTGARMILWDGGLPSFIGSDGLPVKTPTLRAYDPAADTWSASANACEPHLSGGALHMHWTGSHVFVWSSNAGRAVLYDPASDQWEATASLGSPDSRSDAASLWAGDRFMLWGGQQPGGLLDTGYVFSPTAPP